ncbi:MAG: oxidoreductase [Acidobacteria bacterium]|jgi:F420-non-reducing hydrogenase small subunit|nr:oxidoreductase [Acidobacteriota bacterium]
MNGDKLKIALYWGAACGGCDVAVLDTDEFVLELAAEADILFWPIAVDGKYEDIRALPDGALDATLFSGAVRNAENEDVAHLLREKSQVLIALGSCSAFGGIPGLANAVTREEILERVYLDNPSIELGNRTVPRTRVPVNGTELELPAFYPRVWRLSDVVDVDYLVPGCPPAPERVQEVLAALVSGTLPPRGAVVGAAEKALCEECRRRKADKRVARFVRPWEIVPDPESCLLEQGLPCAGPATRGGCGARCPDINQACRGCYGPPPGVQDQGATLVGAWASVIEAKTVEEAETAFAGLPDVLGIAHRFTLPASLLQRSCR